MLKFEKKVRRQKVNVWQQKLTTQTIYEKRNLEARSCNHFCSEKAIGFTYSECMSVALGIQYAMRMRRIVIHSLPGCAIFFPHYLMKGTIKKKVTELKTCVLIFLYNFYVKYFSLWQELRQIRSKMYICVLLKCLLPLFTVNEIWIF